MKKFVKKIIIFGIILLLLSFSLDLIISFGLRKTKCYRYEIFDQIMKGDMNHDVLIMGNSRGFSHFNTAIIDSVCNTDSYNIGLGGYPFNVQIAEYQCYKKHNALPKVIIQETSFSTFGYMDICHQHDSQRFFPTVYDKTMRKELRRLGYGFLELYCPLYRYNGYQMVIKNGLLEFLHLKHFVDRPTYKGFSPEKGPWNGTEAAKIETIKGSFDERSVKLFEDFLADCKQNNIYVLLVNSPVYAPTTAKVENMEELNSYFSETARKYGFTYLNYTKDYDLCNDTSNFCVSVHLNPEGTDKFTIDFANKLDSLQLLN